MQLKVIQTPEEIVDLTNYLKNFQFVAYDTETTGLSKRSEIVGYSICAEESLAYYVVLAKWNKDKQELEYLSANTAPTLELLKLLQTKDLVLHNGLFDCYMTESYFKIPLIKSLHTDTMILAHLLDENRSVGLKELAKQLYGEKETKEQEEMKASVIANGGEYSDSKKGNKELYKADYDVLGKYGAKDAQLTYRLALDLIDELYKQKLDKFFYEDESMPLLRGPTYDLNTTGLNIDLQKLTSLKRQLAAECVEAKAFVLSEINSKIKTKYPGDKKKNTFNIGSSSQLAWLMFGEMNLEFNNLTDEGRTVCRFLGLKLPYTRLQKAEFISACLSSEGTIYQPETKTLTKTIRAKKVKAPWSYIKCDKTLLAKYASKYKWVEKLLEYQRKMKILNTYVEGIEEKVQYGVINPSFLQHGTTSGRYSSNKPNFQNLPRDDKRVKEFVVARPGKVFVGADYSQLEPRVFAYVSQDKNLMAAFDGDADFYSVIGMRVFGKIDCTPHKEGSPNAFGIKYKKLRDISKVIALASTYGATPKQLAPKTGKTIEDTADDIANYFEEFPDVANMMLESHKQVKTQGQVFNLFGRPRRIPDAKNIEKWFGDTSHDELPYEARTLLNLGVNHRIQSTGASIVNRAMINLYNNIQKMNAKIVVQVHDSIVVECDEQYAADVAQILQDSMENTTLLPGVKLEAVPKIGLNLAEV